MQTFHRGLRRSLGFSAAAITRALVDPSAPPGGGIRRFHPHDADGRVGAVESPGTALA